MAKHLLAKGHELALTVHRNRERLADLFAAGATEAASPAALAASSRDRVPLRHRLAPGRGRGRGYRGPAREREAPSRPRRRRLLDQRARFDGAAERRLRGGRRDASSTRRWRAPRSRPRLGKLNVMVGAEPEVFARLEPVLRAFAENVFHVGGPGAGHIIKLLNNFIAQAICTATAEAFAVGARCRRRSRRSWSRWSRSAR